jgi:hypothetical protein
MRRVPLLFALAATLTGCRNVDTSVEPSTPPTQSTTVATNVETSSAPASTPTPIPTQVVTPTTTLTTSSSTTPTGLPAASPAPLASLASADPQRTARAFIEAALSLDDEKLRALSDPSYREQAVSVWIAPTDDFGETPAGPEVTQEPEAAPDILATKLLTNAAGEARVAVFLDSNDLAVAALPFVVQLVERNGQWFVLDASLPTT